MMDDANLGPAMSLAYAEKQGADALARFEEAKTAIVALTRRMANLETALIQLQANVIRLNDEIMRLRQ